MKRFGPPAVIGGVVAEFCPAPSLLGPRWSSFILPAAIAPPLDSLGRHPRSALAISSASIVAPFVMGALLAVDLYSRLSSREVPFPAFAIFLGAPALRTEFGHDMIEVSTENIEAS